MCSASFPLCFSSATRIGLVRPIPEWNLVTLQRHSSFAVCFQASTLSNFLRHRCHQTSTTPVSMPPTYPETTIHPSPVGGSDLMGCPILPHFHMLPQDFWDITTCQVSPALYLLYFQLSLSRQVILIGIFFFSPLTWHQKLAHLTNESMGLMWFVNLGMLL